LQVGEKVIVLRNNLTFGVFNGLILFIKTIHGAAEVTSKDGNHRYPVWHCDCEDEIGNKFTRLPIWQTPITTPFAIKKDTVVPKVVVQITYAYVITCHKSQGSEWDRLLVYDEWMPPQVWDMKRWRYTAITRAAKHLTYCR
jgi:exodeoxyribonuclease-5